MPWLLPLFMFTHVSTSLSGSRESVAVSVEGKEDRVITPWSLSLKVPLVSVPESSVSSRSTAASQKVDGGCWMEFTTLVEARRISERL